MWRLSLGAATSVTAFTFLARASAIIARLHIVPFFPELMERFALSYAQVGVLYAAFFVAYGLLLVPMGIASDRFSPRLLFVIGWGIVGAGIAGVAWAPSYGWLLTARTFSAVGVSMVFPATLKLLSTTFSREQRGKAVGLLEVGGGLGALLCVSAAPALAPLVPLAVLFSAAAAFSLPALAALLLLPKGRQTTGSAATAGAPTGVVQLFGNARLWYYLTHTALATAVVNGVVGWLPTFLQHAEVGKVAEGAAMGLLMVAQMASAWPAGGLSDLMGRRTPVIHLGSMLLCVMPAAVLAGVSANIPLMVLAVLTGAGIGISGTPTGTMGMELYGAEWAGTVTSAAAALSQAASAAIGMLFGWMVDTTGDFASVWIVCLVLMAARIVLTEMVREPRLARSPAQALARR